MWWCLCEKQAARGTAQRSHPWGRKWERTGDGEEAEWLEHEGGGKVGPGESEGLGLDQRCVRFPCCSDISPQPGRLKTTEVHSHSSGGQRSEIRVSAGPAPSEGSRGESIPHLFCSLGAPGAPWLVATSPQSLPPFSRGHFPSCALLFF